MARITVEDCQKVINDRFEIIRIAAARARELQDGAESPIQGDDHKPSVIALKEIAEGYLTSEGLVQPEGGDTENAVEDQE